MVARVKDYRLVKRETGSGGPYLSTNRLQRGIPHKSNQEVKRQGLFNMALQLLLILLYLFHRYPTANVWCIEWAKKVLTLHHKVYWPKENISRAKYYHSLMIRCRELSEQEEQDANR